MTKATYYSADIACDGCTSSIEEALSKLAGIASVSGNPDTKQVKVEFHDTVVSEEAILAKLNELGFESKRVDD
ncbi:MAG: heavy-metal-associated domain-containing protein [Armatimonadetes bacterium]|nr:heavy-metal-associated domain-containing protein [Armatimonadota bacterium]